MLRQILVVFIFFLSYCSSPPKAPISNSINTSLENSSQTTRDYFSNERQYITIYGREVYSKLSNESISLYDQIKTVQIFMVVRMIFINSIFIIYIMPIPKK